MQTCPRREVLGGMLGGMLGGGVGTGAGLGATPAQAQQWPYWTGGTREERARREQERRARRAAGRREREMAKAWDTSLPDAPAILQRLEALPSIASGTRGGLVIWEISFRDCPPCIIFARDGAGQLGRLGFEVRTVLFAPSSTVNGSGRSAGPGELAALAALYRTRDAALMHDWFHFRPSEGFAAARGLAPVEAGSPGMAQINAVRAAVRAIGQSLERAGGLRTGYPAFFWTDPRRGPRYAMGWGSGVPAPLQALAASAAPPGPPVPAPAPAPVAPAGAASGPAGRG